MNQRAILAFLLSFCTLTQVVAQTRPAADNDDVVRISTNLVQIDVVVTRDGKPVTNLSAGDFELYEDGKRQDISNFAFISNVAPRTASDNVAKADKGETTVPGAPPAPVKLESPHRTIAVVVDDLGLSAESLNQVRRQLRKFVAEELQPNDLVAIVRTGGEIGALQQFTNDQRLLTRAVDQLRWNVCSRVGVSVFPRYGQALTGFDWENCNPFDDGTRRALNSILDSLGRLPGRKSLILMSDDMPIEQQEQAVNGDSFVTVGSTIPIGPVSQNRGDALKRIAEKAIRSSVVIYSVDTQGLQFTGPMAADNVNSPPGIGPQKVSPLDPNGANAMMRSRSQMLQMRREGGELIAKQTGGFQIRNSNGFQLDRILEDQSGYYLLGYRPTEETFNRQFHHIKAKVKRSGLTVRTRFGFWGVSEEDVKRTANTTGDETNLALISPFAAQDLEFDLSSFFADAKSGGSVVRSFIYLDAGQLSFTPVNDRHETSLEIHGAIFGDNGALEEQQKTAAVLSLKENEYKEALRDGLRLRFDMPAKHPGSYQVRIAVRDRTSTKIGSAGQFIAVPDLMKKRLALSGLVLRDSTSSASQTAVMTSPAARRVPLNSDLRFAFVIYNASSDLVMQTRLVRDGKIVKSGPETTVDVANQADKERLFVTSAFRLSPDLEPGSYYLQVVVTDKTAKDKQPPVTQWVNFEIVK